jgi:ABC-type nitrate/sulfonate/bicarbonate transport system substrate-binding protein
MASIDQARHITGGGGARYRRRSKRAPLRRLAPLAVAVSTLAAVGVVGVPASSAAGVGSALSASSISIGGSVAGDFGLTWIAQKAGFFKQQGLTVKFVNFAVGTGSTSGITSAFLGGSFNFLNNAASATMYAQQAGAPIQAIMQDDVGQQQEIAIHSDIATKLHIPAADATPAEALAQFKALKGTHLSVGVTSTTSPAYNSIVAIAKKYGLTYGLNSSGADIDLVTTGTATAQSSGFNAAKFDAIGSSPPQSLRPDTTVINLGLIPPVSAAAGLYLVGLTSFMKAHPDTTQALINAEVEAWEYAHQHPQQAEKLLVSMEAENDQTDPATVQTLYNDLARYWKTPYPQQSAFNGAKQLVNQSQPKPLTVTYSQWADPSYVAKAAKDLTLTVPVPTTN